LSSPVVENPTLHYALKEAMKLLVDFNADGEESMRTLQIYFVASVLRSVGGNKCRAARRLGVHRNTLWKYVEELHLQPLVEQLGQLRRTQVRQLNLFPSTFQVVPIRVGLAQDTLVLNRKSQGKNSVYPQLTNRMKNGKVCGSAS
jgi:hypothetical protein